MIHPALRYAIAAFYAYGALVHAMNMSGASGFHWPEAPLRWQLLDVVYLALDVFIAVGLLRAARSALVALVVAAGSQIVLYTVLRGWILDVPAAFAPTAEQLGYLDLLVAFHAVCLSLVALDLARRHRAAGIAAPSATSRPSDAGTSGARGRRASRAVPGGPVAVLVVGPAATVAAPHDIVGAADEPVASAPGTRR